MIACLSTPSIPSPSVCNSALLPRRPHAGLGTYPRVPYVSTPHGTQSFGDRRAVLVILSCAGTRRISQHRIACSARMTRRAREKLWLPLCLMQLWGHVPPSTGRTGRYGGKHEFQAAIGISIYLLLLYIIAKIFRTKRTHFIQKSVLPSS